MNGTAPTWSTLARAGPVVLAPQHLKRTVSIALIVGTVFFAMNQLGVILDGRATAVVWIKAALTYLTPLLVSNFGLLSATRRPDCPARRHHRCDEREIETTTNRASLRASERNKDMDETKMTEFVEKAVGDVGALLGGAMVVIGDKLGPVSRDGRSRSAHPGGTGRPHRDRRAVRARVVERPSGPRLPVLRRRRPVLCSPTSTPSRSPMRPARPA